jgi:hypothetical protein
VKIVFFTESVCPPAVIYFVKKESLFALKIAADFPSQWAALLVKLLFLKVTLNTAERSGKTCNVSVEIWLG